jgi:hypothetical protein
VSAEREVVFTLAGERENNFTLGTAEVTFELLGDTLRPWRSRS